MFRNFRLFKDDYIFSYILTLRWISNHLRYFKYVRIISNPPYNKQQNFLVPMEIENMFPAHLI